MSTTQSNSPNGNDTIYVRQTTVSQDPANNRSYIHDEVWVQGTQSFSQPGFDYHTYFDGDDLHNVRTLPSGSYNVSLRDEYRYVYHDAYGNRSVNTGATGNWPAWGTAAVSFSVALPNLSSVPGVSTYGYDFLTSTSCATYGDLYFNGNNPVTAAGTVWSSTTGSPTIADNAISVTGQNGVYQANLTGLTPGTAYAFRAYATNGIGTSYGTTTYFTTPLATPVVTTSAATSIGLTGATANGSVTSGDGITATGIAYGTSANPTTAGSTVTGSGAIGSMALSITGLSNGTLYHYRAYATNPNGTVYGSDVSFTTLQNPTVTSSAASAVLVTTATANGNLTVAGNPVITEKGFVYSASANPTTADTKIIVAGNSTGAYTGSMTGLTSNTTYHYRAYATSSQGTFYSADQSLTTDISYFTNPANAYVDDNVYATASSDSGVIAVHISKDGGTTWSTPKTNTYTGSQGYQTYGSTTDTWGLSMTGADINSATLFCVKITSGTTNQHSQIYKGFGYAETAGSSVTGLQVQIDAKYASSTVSVDHLRVIPTMSGTNTSIVTGSTAYDSTLNTLTAYNGSTWDVILKSGGALGTPASGVATNLTGTASGLTAGNVTTNANLTGDVTSSGNATTIGAGKVTNTMLVANVLRSGIYGTTQATTLGPNNTQYVGIAEVGSNQYLVPLFATGTIKNLYVWIGGSPGASQTYTCTLMKNASAQTLTAQIVAGTNTASDTTHSFSVSAGDRLSLRVATSATATAYPLQWCVEYDI